MKTLIAKLPHGWYKGKLKETDVIDTIESSIGRYDIAIVELAEDNEITQREREYLSKQTIGWAISWLMTVIQSIYPHEWFTTEVRCSMA